MDKTGVVVASRAIDGNTANNHFDTLSVSITEKSDFPWWKVEFPYVYPILITKIVLCNRGGEVCDKLCTFRLSNSEVRIMDDDVVIDVESTNDSTNVVAFPFDYGEGVTGNTVMIQKVGYPTFT